MAFGVAVVVLAAHPAVGEWIPPVDAPVVDGFRPPKTRYGSGNRGLEYGLSAGQAFIAVDSGTVVYAGRVGQHRHITVDHGDGLRSTYAFVTTIEVVRGQRVRQGQRLGTAGPGFHLTARLGDTYVDPNLLFAGYEVSLRLTESALPSQAGRSSAGRSEVAPVERSGWDALLAANDAASQLSLTNRITSAGMAAGAWLHLECTPDESPVASQAPGSAGERRVLIQVGGLGSSTDDASITQLDEEALGYADDDVIRFSYAGLCDGPKPSVQSPPVQSNDAGDGPSAGSLEEALPQESYEGMDTHQDVYASAENLADLIEAANAERPGQPIDIAAHSLGGVVTRLALEILQERGGPLPSVVVTIGSPHGGANLGTAAQVGAGAPAGSVIAGITEAVTGDDLANADSVAQIAQAGSVSLDPPGLPPEGVTVVAIAGSTDLVVPAENATWDGATNTIVPTAGSGLDAHSDLPGTWQVQREIELALAGAAPRCVGLGTVLAGAGASGVTSAAESGAAIVIGAARWLR